MNDKELAPPAPRPSCAATVMLPTTGDRGPLLEYSIPSILGQSIGDLELFVIGDGLTEDTRRIVRAFEAKDSRVRLFDFPKDQRRGEVYRHQVLSDSARGRIVCYLCDRDLMLPDHVATLDEYLREHDLVFGFFLRVMPKSLELTYGSPKSYMFGSITVRDFGRVPGKLSCVGHTMDMYRRLPHGWRTTPEGRPTDRYMWRQFLEHPDCRARAIHEPTILYLKRGRHPGWPMEKRLADLRTTSEHLDKHGVDRVKEEAMEWVFRELKRKRRKRA